MLNLLKKRRSIYNLGKEKIVSQTKIIEVVEQTIKHLPSSFNSQSTRIVLLFGPQHELLWDKTKDCLREIVPAAAFEQTETKIDNCFKAGYATLLFYEDQEVVEQLCKNFPTYQDKFPIWAEHANAMAQLALWTQFADLNLGASLQHYNPIIDEMIIKTWQIPRSWKLIAQMPVGSISKPAEERTYLPIADRVLIYK